MEYSSAAIYINSASSLSDKVRKLDDIINALLNAATSAAENQSILGYSLDDGQTKINTQYRSSQEAFEAIKSFENLKNFYENMIDSRVNGRVVRLVDGKNFRRGGRF